VLLRLVPSKLNAAMAATAINAAISAYSIAVHEKELLADLGADLFLLIGWSREHCCSAGALAVECVAVEQDCRHDFGHDVGIDDKGRH